MPNHQFLRSVTAGAVLLTLGGCYSPYAGYPPAGYPGTGAPMTQPAVPQSSFVMPGDSLGNPAPVPSNPNSTFAPSGRVQAPDPATQGTQGTGNGGNAESPVPPPRDPAADAGSQSTQGSTQTSALPGSDPEVARGKPAELNFKAPVVFAGSDEPTAGAGEQSGVVTAAAALPASSGEASSEQSFDPNYTWFQGRLEFNEADGAWHLTYDDSPEPHDQLGGEITLSSDVQLDAQHNGTLVRVTGEFNAAKLDRLQKPIFQVTRIDPL